MPVRGTEQSERGVRRADEVRALLASAASASRDWQTLWTARPLSFSATELYPTRLRHRAYSFSPLSPPSFAPSFLAAHAMDESFEQAVAFVGSSSTATSNETKLKVRPGSRALLFRKLIFPSSLRDSFTRCTRSPRSPLGQLRRGQAC